jgi:superfamily II DNA/RNA helicase
VSFFLADNPLQNVLVSNLEGKAMNFDELQAILLNWPPAHNAWPVNVEDSLMSRICQVLQAAQTGINGNTWQADLQPLVRHWLLRESSRAVRAVQLSVPAGQNWPDQLSWMRHGVQVVEAGQAYILEARPWQAEWLDGNERGVFADAFSDRSVRPDTRCEADPFVADATGFQHYSCPGQREAVRAAFLIPPGDTLMVNLPTGSGKSLVGQAPALVHGTGHLTVFVVPTVALALDQERAMQQLLQINNGQPAWRLAWYGGLSAEHRQEIRQHLQQGTQRILFTSPEALTTSLLRAVSDVARNGMLDYFVIDEAHLITQWGDEFRPEFQILAGLRNSLLRLAPQGRAFRTLLLTATFTQETVETLRDLFGPPERVQMVAAVHLRPEPQYWFYKANGHIVKQEPILEALRHAPRPFILYVTKREEILTWNQILRDQGGLRRLATFDGGTPNQERERIIQEWAANRLDGIIATSAFGVGLDKSDVRTVIHATIPETLDRYYQEVGRGGRDGKPSVSLLVFDDDDWTLPRRLAAPALITETLGFERWQAMYQSRQTTEENDLWKIDIDAVRPGLLGGGGKNIKWNMRTLNLMVRAGLIRLELDVNNEIPAIDPGEATAPLFAMTNLRVRICNHGHLLPETWEERITPLREKILTAANRNLAMMQQLLPKRPGQAIDTEVGSILRQLYQFQTPWWVDVVPVCGGCPLDRHQSRSGVYPQPIVLPVQRVRPFDTPVWHQHFGWVDPALAFVFYDETRDWNDIQRDILQFAGWLIQQCDVRELAIGPRSRLRQSPEWNGLYRHTSERVLLQQPLASARALYTSLPRLTVLEPDTVATFIQPMRLLQRPFHIVLLPRNTPDPQNSARRFIDVSPNQLVLETILYGINQ